MDFLLLLFNGLSKDLTARQVMFSIGTYLTIALVASLIRGLVRGYGGEKANKALDETEKGIRDAVDRLNPLTPFARKKDEKDNT